jgi:hypothetical protein
MWGAVKEALFAVHREVLPRYELGVFKNLYILKMEVICSSETSVLSRATRCKFPKRHIIVVT